MLKLNSILRRLPAELDDKQTLFLDGIRHSAEITDLAYQRLKITLTKIALEEEKSEAYYTHAFLDVWAIVDSIDRYRTLWNLFPDANLEKGDAGPDSDRAIFQQVRNVRNVTDHLAQRMDYVLSKKSSALGSLSWCTIVNIESAECVICSIIPGTMGRRTGPMVNPGGKVIEVPTGLITLTAGEHTVEISEAVKRFSAQICDLEAQVENCVSEMGLSENRAGADLLVKMSARFADSDKERSAPSSIEKA